jgi:L-ascorbate metabolism protein UlaG (beta-lactamase superfamily)
MPINLKWFGHASFRIEYEGIVVYIDPWKIPVADHDADVVLVSHSHYDHCSRPDVDKVSKDDTLVVAPADTIAKLKLSNAVTPQERLTVKEIVIEPVAMYNIDKVFHPRGHNWFGAVITIGGRRIYYAGDTDLVPEMSDLKDVDLCLFPVGGTYTLNAAEAARACQAVGCAAAIPYHWGDIIGSEDDAREFERLAPCKVHVLQAGGELSIP